MVVTLATGGGGGGGGATKKTCKMIRGSLIDDQMNPLKASTVISWC